MLKNKSNATKHAEGYNSLKFIPVESLSYLGKGEYFLSINSLNAMRVER